MRTLDLVEAARSRLVGLVRATPQMADRDDVATRLENTVSHCWCLWLTPRPSLPALLVSGEWSLSAFALSGLFSRVEVWETDKRRADLLSRVASDIEPRLNVRHVLPEDVAGGLARLGEPFGVAALEGTLGLSPGNSRDTRVRTLRGLLAASGAAGQCCVVARNRFALGNSALAPFKGDRSRLPTPREVRREWGSDDRRTVSELYFHPDHHGPTELLFPPTILPRSRRRRMVMRLLERAGVVELVLGSFASFSSAQPGKLLVDHALEPLVAIYRYEHTG